MRYLMIGLVLILALGNCKKSGQTPAVVLNGTYKGTFQRITYGANAGAISQVALQFSNGSWVGTSDHTKYPALCNGTFSQQGDSLKVSNGCAWTAEFDWSLIFGGGYAVHQAGDSIRFTRNFTANVQDVYALAKQQ